MSILFDKFDGLEPKSLEFILKACRMPTPEMVPASTYKDISQVKVSGLAYDSRQVKPGDAYFAISGAKFDGNAFIDQAVLDGANCIFTAKEPSPEQKARIPIIVVDDVLKAQAAVANALYDTPSSRIRVLGVTGTNGKTTTTHLIERIFNTNGKPCGLIGTLGARVPGVDENSAASYLDMHHTTPQPADLQAILYAMAQRGLSHVAMEVSSHALALGRVLGTRFAGAALTNITQDHLDFHKTMEHYAQSKKKLFEMIDESARSNEIQGTTCAINLDDEYADMFLRGLSDKVQILTYGFSPKAAIRPKRAEFGFDGMRLSLSTTHGDIDFHTPLTGRFNLYNIMTAMALALGEGIPLEGIAQSLQDFAGVSGRFESVSIQDQTNKQAGLPLCLVDYAHTPDGLENVLKAGRQLVPDKGRLIVVFGCGGDRDSSKRPQMGRLAETLADIVIITSDNPRTEEPDQIIADILAGIDSLKDVVVEQDRAAAIDLAVQKGGPDDVVIIAGKGHETYQILKDRTIDFDDRLAVKNALKTKMQKR